MSHHPSYTAGGKTPGIFKLTSDFKVSNGEVWLNAKKLSPVLIERRAITAPTTSTSFTIFAGNYDRYILYIYRLLPSTTGARLCIQYSTDGTTYLTSNYSCRYMSTSTSVTGQSSIISRTTPTLTNSASSLICATATLYRPTQSGLPKQFEISYAQVTPTAVNSEKILGVNTSTAAIKGLRFYFNNGSIAQGVFCLYGVT